MADPASGIDVDTLIIAGIAVAATIITFVITYSRTRRSEQVKIVREIMFIMEMKYTKLREIRDKLPVFESEQPWPKVDIKLEEQAIRAMQDLLAEIDFIRHLLNEEEINDNVVLAYCIPRVRDMFASISNMNSLLNRYANPSSSLAKLMKRRIRLKLT